MRSIFGSSNVKYFKIYQIIFTVAGYLHPQGFKSNKNRKTKEGLIYSGHRITVGFFWFFLALS